MTDFKKAIGLIIEKSAGIKIDLSILSIPPDPKMGDYSLPCFTLAKEMKKSPQQVAEEIVRKIAIVQPIVRVDIKGPYINFFVNKAILAQEILSRINEEKENYGTAQVAQKQRSKVMVEFPSPNTNKPLHLGHIRNMLLGESVSRLLEASGSKVIRANVNNDRGVHICKSMLAYDRWGNDRDPDKKSDHFVGDFYVLFSKEAEKNPELEKEAQEMLVLWEKKDKRVRELWKLMNTWAYGGFEATYEALDISFDKYYYESEYYDKGREIVLKALKKGLFSKDETGAITAPLQKYNLQDKVVLRGDGTSLYITQDIYLAIKKFEDYGLERSIYVVGNEQNEHFRQLFSVLDMLGHRWAKKCLHLSYGMVFLPHGRMKSREGTVVDADDLIEEMKDIAKREIERRHPALRADELEKRAKMIGLGALRFFMLKNDPARDMTYNPEESISFEGETGPYVQYAHARICSMLRKHIEDSRIVGAAPSVAAARAPSLKKSKASKNTKTKSKTNASGKDNKKAGNTDKISKKSDAEEKISISAAVDYSLLKSEPEQRLIILLSQYPGIVQKAAADLKPSLVAHYLVRLSQEFTSFYHDCPVLIAEPEVKKARLLLSDCVRQTIGNGLRTLGIDAPREM